MPVSLPRTMHSRLDVVVFSLPPRCHRGEEHRQEPRSSVSSADKHHGCRRRRSCRGLGRGLGGRYRKVALCLDLKDVEVHEDEIELVFIANT